MTFGEAGAVATLHVAAFRGFYLTALGKRFLTGYYQRVSSYPAGISIGAFESSRIVGVAAGFVNPAAFYDSLRKDKLRLVFAAAPALVFHPRRLARFARNYTKTRAMAAARPDRSTAELASLGVHPSCGGQGIGERLVRQFVAAARDRGALQVTLTTDANANEQVNHFYQKLGFRLVACNESQPGRYLNHYVIDVV